MANRKTLVEEVQARIENSMELLGATAVEDALQDNVKDTLESLRYAGILVWVLTGDKIETALNIAKSCGHIPETSRTYFVAECKEEEHIHEHLNLLEEEMQVYRISCKVFVKSQLPKTVFTEFRLKVCRTFEQRRLIRLHAFV